MSSTKAAITAVGAYVPDDVLSNQDLEKMVETNSDWIISRTGIKERRILKDNEKGSSYLGIKASENLIKKSGIDPESIDMVIFATATPDMPVAASANYLATKIGAKNAFSYDLMAACSSFLYGMSTASAYIESGRYKRILLVGADKMSSIIDYQDRATCIIFGDGGGAVLFEPNDENLGLQDEILKTDGNGREFLKIDAGGSMMPASHQTVEERKHYVFQDGRTVFKFAVSNMASVSEQIMKRNGLRAKNVDWLVAHQANKRIIAATAARMNLEPEKVLMNIQRYGNTTSATLPLLLSDYEKKLKKGDNIIFATFGGGFTWGSIYLKWAYNSN